MFGRRRGVLSLLSLIYILCSTLSQNLYQYQHTNRACRSRCRYNGTYTLYTIQYGFCAKYIFSKARHKLLQVLHQPHKRQVLRFQTIFAGLGIRSLQKNVPDFAFFVKERSDLCVLFRSLQRMLRSVRSFPFFIKELSDLWVLFRFL